MNVTQIALAKTGERVSVSANGVILGTVKDGGNLCEPLATHSRAAT